MGFRGTVPLMSPSYHSPWDLGCSPLCHPWGASRVLPSVALATGEPLVGELT